MKEREAIAQGFSYTGMSASEWDRERWEEYKKEAQEIRKTYKGADFRVVTETCRSRLGNSIYKSIYGNEVFCKVQYFNQADEEKYLNELHNQRLVNLKEEYDKKVTEEMEYYKNKLAEYKYIMSIKK